MSLKQLYSEIQAGDHPGVDVAEILFDVFDQLLEGLGLQMVVEVGHASVTVRLLDPDGNDLLGDGQND